MVLCRSGGAARCAASAQGGGRPGRRIAASLGAAHALLRSPPEGQRRSLTAEGIMYHSLLVPLDGSVFGEHALPLALTLARRCGAELHLLHVIQPVASIYSETPLFVDDDLGARLRRQLLDERGAYLNGVAARLREAGAAAVRTEVAEGDVADAIRQRAEAARADLVVMTTHG